MYKYKVHTFLSNRVYKLRCKIRKQILAIFVLALLNYNLTTSGLSAAILGAIFLAYKTITVDQFRNRCVEL